MKHNVLIVDDEQSVRESLTSVLATYGFRTASCDQNCNSTMSPTDQRVRLGRTMRRNQGDMTHCSSIRPEAQTAADWGGPKEPLLILSAHA